MSPEEDRTRDAVDSEPKHYQLSYSGPKQSVKWYFDYNPVTHCAEIGMLLFVTVAFPWHSLFEHKTEVSFAS